MSDHLGFLEPFFYYEATTNLHLSAPRMLWTLAYSAGVTFNLLGDI